MPRHKNADWGLAFLEGKAIQIRRKDSNDWKDFLPEIYAASVFDYEFYEFRLKPREPRRIFINDCGQMNPSWHESKESADKHAFPGRIGCVEFVEVIAKEGE